MQATRILLALLATVSADDSATPAALTKVVSLMTDVKTELGADLLAYGTESAKKTANLEATITMKTRTASQEKATYLQAEQDETGADNQIAQLNGDIDAKKAQIDAWDSEVSSALASEGSRKTTSAAAIKDLADSITSLEAAIAAMGSLRSSDSDGTTIVDILTQLKEQFVTSKQEAELESLHAAGNHSVAIATLEGEISLANQQISFWETEVSDQGIIKAQAAADYQSAFAAYQKAESESGATSIALEAHNTEVAAYVEALKAEIAALTQALKQLSVIQSSASASMLMQLRADRSLSPRVAEYLEKQGKQLNSHILSALAVRARSGGDAPFAKIKALISSMLTKLREEASSEADKHGVCQKNLASFGANVDGLEADISGYTADLEIASGKVTLLEAEISELSADVAELSSNLLMASGIRSEESATNTKIMGDADDAAEAVRAAKRTLEAFYSGYGAGGGSQTYKVHGAKAGILGLLEVLESDFISTHTETDTAEAEAVSAFNSFKTETASDVATKQTSLSSKRAELESEEGKVSAATTSLSTAESDLVDAQAALDAQKANCNLATSTHAERTQARAAEISVLQCCIKLLDGEASCE